MGDVFNLDQNLVISFELYFSEGELEHQRAPLNILILLMPSSVYLLASFCNHIYLVARSIILRLLFLVRVVLLLGFYLAIFVQLYLEIHGLMNVVDVVLLDYVIETEELEVLLKLCGRRSLLDLSNPSSCWCYRVLVRAHSIIFWLNPLVEIVWNEYCLIVKTLLIERLLEIVKSLNQLVFIYMFWRWVLSIRYAPHYFLSSVWNLHAIQLFWSIWTDKIQKFFYFLIFEVYLNLSLICVLIKQFSNHKTIWQVLHDLHELWLDLVSSYLQDDLLLGCVTHKEREEDELYHCKSNDRDIVHRSHKIFQMQLKY